MQVAEPTAAQAAFAAQMEDADDALRTSTELKQSRAAITEALKRVCDRLSD